MRGLASLKQYTLWGVVLVVVSAVAVYHTDVSIAPGRVVLPVEDGERATLEALRGGDSVVGGSVDVEPLIAQVGELWDLDVGVGGWERPYRMFMQRRLGHAWREAVVVPPSGLGQGNPPPAASVQRVGDAGNELVIASRASKRGVVHCLEACGCQLDVMSPVTPWSVTGPGLSSPVELLDPPYRILNVSSITSVLPYDCRENTWENPLKKILARKRIIVNEVIGDWWHNVSAAELDTVTQALQRKHAPASVLTSWWKGKERLKCISTFGAREPTCIHDVKVPAGRVVPPRSGRPHALLNLHQCFAPRGRNISVVMYGHSHLWSVAQKLCTSGLLTGHRLKSCYRTHRSLRYYNVTYNLPNASMLLPNVDTGRDPREITHVVYARGLWDQLDNATRPQDYYLSVLKALRTLRSKFPQARIVMYMQHYGHPPRSTRWWAAKCATAERQHMYRVLNLCAARTFHKEQAAAFDAARRRGSGGNDAEATNGPTARYGIEIFDPWEITNSPVTESVSDNWGHHYSGIVLQEIVTSLFHQLCGRDVDEAYKAAAQEGRLTTMAAPVSARDVLLKSATWKSVLRRLGNHSVVMPALSARLAGDPWWAVCEQQERYGTGASGKGGEMDDHNLRPFFDILFSNRGLHDKCSPPKAGDLRWVRVAGLMLVGLGLAGGIGWVFWRGGWKAWGL